MESLPAGELELAGHDVQVEDKVAPKAAEYVPATRPRQPDVIAPFPHLNLTPLSYMIAEPRDAADIHHESMLCTITCQHASYSRQVTIQPIELIASHHE